MWVFTPIGFISVVQDNTNPEFLVVRSRVRKDLATIRRRYFNGMGAIVSNAGTDYPYRAFIAKSDFAVGMTKIVTDIDYTNFKNEVHDHQGEFRANVYGKVWGNLWNLEQLEDDAKKNKPKFNRYASNYYHD